MKNISTYAEENGLNLSEILRQDKENKKDFTINKTRFILESNLVQVLTEQFKNDPTALGEFPDYFISQVCNIDLDKVQKMQLENKFKDLGKIILKGDLDNFMCEYFDYQDEKASFESYNGDFEIIIINQNSYIIFEA